MKARLKQLPEEHYKVVTVYVMLPEEHYKVVTVYVMF